MKKVLFRVSEWVLKNVGWLPLSFQECLFVCYCLFGALTPTFAVWNITVTGDNMVLREQSGSHCCFFVPNPVLKTHRWKEILNETLVLAFWRWKNLRLLSILQNGERRWEHMGGHTGLQENLCQEGFGGWAQALDHRWVVHPHQVAKSNFITTHWNTFLGQADM